MTITAIRHTVTPDAWIEDEDGFSICEGVFLAWHEGSGPDDGFTVGILDHMVTQSAIGEALNAVIDRFGDCPLERVYSKMGALHFVFGPLS